MKFNTPATRFLLAIPTMIVFLSGCSSTNVQVAHDTNTTFGRVQRIAWHPNGNTLRGVRADFALDAHELIRVTIENKLKRKGMVIVHPDGADMLIAYHLGVQDKGEVTKWGYMDKFGGRQAVPVETHRYREGTLYVDIVDPKTSLLAWRGAATGTREANDSDGTIRARIVSAINRMFASYPPR